MRPPGLQRWPSCARSWLHVEVAAHRDVVAPAAVEVQVQRSADLARALTGKVGGEEVVAAVGATVASAPSVVDLVRGAAGIGVRPLEIGDGVAEVLAPE